MPPPSAGTCSGLDMSLPGERDNHRTGQHEADSATEPAEQPAGRRLNRGATALIGVLPPARGFGLAVQLQSNSKNDSLANAREEDLVRILDDQNSRIQRLQSQLTDL